MENNTKVKELEKAFQLACEQLFLDNDFVCRATCKIPKHDECPYNKELTISCYKQEFLTQAKESLTNATNTNS